jgi:hypothetical protein
MELAPALRETISPPDKSNNGKARLPASKILRLHRNYQPVLTAIQLEALTDDVYTLFA